MMICHKAHRCDIYEYLPQVNSVIPIKHCSVITLILGKASRLLLISYTWEVMAYPLAILVVMYTLY